MVLRSNDIYRLRRRSFSDTGPLVWNVLPLCLQQDISYGQFKQHLQTLLFGSSWCILTGDLPCLKNNLTYLSPGVTKTFCILSLHSRTVEYCFMDNSRCANADRGNCHEYMPHRCKFYMRVLVLGDPTAPKWASQAWLCHAFLVLLETISLTNTHKSLVMTFICC